MLVLRFTDNLLASGSKDCKVKLWDGSTYELLRELHHDTAVMSLAFSDDRRICASGSENSVQLWACDSGKLMRSLDESMHEGKVMSFVFSPFDCLRSSIPRTQVTGLEFCGHYLCSAGSDGKVLKTEIVHHRVQQIDLGLQAGEEKSKSLETLPPSTSSPSKGQESNADLSDLKVQVCSSNEQRSLL